MSVEQHKALLRQWNEGWNSHELALIDRLVEKVWSAEVVIHNAEGSADVVGSQWVREFVHNAIRNQPDIQVTLEDMVAEGDIAVCRYTVTGTHPNSGKIGSLFIIQTFRFSGGKITEAWSLESPVDRQGFPTYTIAPELLQPREKRESPAAGKAGMLRWYNAMNSLDMARLDLLLEELIVPDFTLTDPTSKSEIKSLAQLRQWAQGLFNNCSMMDIVVDDLIAEGDRLAARSTVKITGIKSGQTVRFPMMSIFRVSGGKIVEEWGLTGPRVEVSPAAAVTDPIEVVVNMEARLNAGDLPGNLAFFAPEATFVVPPDGQLLTGKPAIQAWLEPQMNHILVASRNRRAAGKAVEWEGTLTGELLRQSGLLAVEQTMRAVVRDGQIVSMVLTTVGQTPAPQANL